MDSSRRDLFIDMAVHRFILKNNQIKLSPRFASKQVWDYLKQGLVFTEYCRRSANFLKLGD